MTFKEAKKILKKEGFYVEKATRPCAISESFIEYEDPTICEAMQVVSSAGYFVGMEVSCFDERKARLKKKLEEHANAPVSGKEKAKEKKGIIYPSTSPKADFYYKHVLNEGNPALKEAASQFNDALLDEQAKEIECLRDKCKKLVDILDSVTDKLRKLKAENSRIKNSDLNLEGLIYATRELKEKNKEIAELTKENEDLKSWRENLNREISLNTVPFINETKRLSKEIARLNKIIHKKNLKIEELRKEGSRHLRGKVKMFGETVDLSQELCDKNEDIRLSKIREKNLTEVCQKYVNENEKLKKKLAEKIVDEIDARALKSAESALAYKEKVIAEKDEVIADLGKELAATKKELEAFKESYKRRIKEDSEHFEDIQKICNVGLQKWLIETEYLEKDKPFRFPQLPDFSEEEEKKLSSVKDDNSHGEVTNQKDISPSLKVTVRLFGDDVRDLFKNMQHLW